MNAAATPVLPWSNVGRGTYVLSAKATDNRGLITTSSAVNITVTSGAAQLFFIYNDQLNTPRVITDQTNKVVWRWDNNDPFGANVPDEDPDGDGNKFTCNLRLPGQYFDRDTNTQYNYFRDYDPNIGRYLQPEPLGVLGDLNLYRYSRNNPLTYFDPDGRFSQAIIFIPPIIIAGAWMANTPEGRKTVKNIAQKIQDLCTPGTKDPCDQQQEDEEQECWDKYGSVFGASHFSYQGCLERTKIRADLCRRGLPQPPKWSDADVTGQPPTPRLPRTKR